MSEPGEGKGEGGREGRRWLRRGGAGSSSSADAKQEDIGSILRHGCRGKSSRAKHTKVEAWKQKADCLQRAPRRNIIETLRQGIKFSIC